MDKRTVLEILENFRKALEKRGIVSMRMVLFGSYATGTFHEGSDIDVVVVSDDFMDKDYWERIDILSEAITEVWAPIEAIAKTTQEWCSGNSLIVEFAKNGELVYQSEDTRGQDDLAGLKA